jgi:hypothetical protein
LPGLARYRLSCDRFFHDANGGFSADPFDQGGGCRRDLRTAGQLSLVDRRLFNFLLAHAYPHLGKQPKHVVRLADIRGFAAAARDGSEETDNRRLKASVERLQRTLVKFNYLDSEKARSGSPPSSSAPARSKSGPAN